MSIALLLVMMVGAGSDSPEAEFMLRPDALTLPISSSACVEYALEVSPRILVTEYERPLAQSRVGQARGSFDPTFQWHAAYSDEDRKRRERGFDLDDVLLSREDEKRDRDTRSIGAGVTGLLPWGTQYSLTTIYEDQDRDDSTFDLGIDASVPETLIDALDRSEDSTTVAFTLRQPLLRERGKEVNLAEQRIAEAGVDAATEQIRTAHERQAAAVLYAYWGLVRAHEERTVRAQALENARQLLSDNEERLRVGVAPVSEVQQSRAGVASRESALIAAQGEVARAENNLKLMVGLVPEDPLSEYALIPSEDPLSQYKNIDESASLALALESRPELAALKVQVAQREIALKRLNNKRLPAVDLVASVSQINTDRDDDELLTPDTRDEDETIYTIGIEGEFPFGNRRAENEYLEAKYALEQAEQALAAAEQEIGWDVRQALDHVRVSNALVKKAQESTQYAEDVLDAEYKRLQLGVSNSFQVLRLEDDLTDAQLEEVRSQTALEDAIVTLQLAQGTLLHYAGIDGVPTRQK